MIDDELVNVPLRRHPLQPNVFEWTGGGCPCCADMKLPDPVPLSKQIKPPSTIPTTHLINLQHNKVDSSDNDYNLDSVVSLLEVVD